MIPLPPVVIALVAAVLVSTAWVWRAWPRSAPEVVDPHVPCLSYAPFRRAGHTPLDERVRVTPQQIEADLRVLGRLTGCVRTYGTGHGLDALPAVAARLGMTVMLGAWIGRDAEASGREVRTAVALAHAHPGTVVRLVIGNEVLLRGDLPAPALAGLLRQTRALAPVPVAYADVWEFWLRHPEIADAVDIVAYHALPYWEDVPVAADRALEHVRWVSVRMQARFPGQPTWLAETGWPSVGRDRGAARAGRLEQARVLRALVAGQASLPAGMNLIEAFDQPWKRRFEGAMGAGWGLFDAQARPKFGWQGPVRADPAAPGVVLALAGAAVVGAAAAVARTRRAGAAGERDPARGRGGRPALLGGALALAALAAAIGQWQHLAAAAERPLQWGVGAAALLLAWWHATSVARAAAAGPGHLAAGPGHLAAGPSAALLAAVAVALALLVLDGRYRGFPHDWLLPPLLALALARAAGVHPGGRDPYGLVAIALAVVIAVLGAALVVVEGTANLAATAFALQSVAVALLAVVPASWRRRVPAA